jgi:hypothetical protein
MSDLQNPIFENEKEFLERQKQEYKNALMGDVAVIKDQSTEIGKKVLLAGGVLAGVWMATKLLSGKKKKKNKKKARKLLQKQTADSLAGMYLQHIQPASQPHGHDEVTFGSPLDFSQPSEESDASYYNTPAKYFDPNLQSTSAMPGNYALHNHYHAAAESRHETYEKPGIVNDLVKAMATQVTAFLLVYLSKKAEEFLLKNVDIAGHAPETTDADFSYEADAGKPYL